MMKSTVKYILPFGLVLGCMLSCSKYAEETNPGQDCADETISTVTYTIPDLIDDEEPLTKVILDENNNLLWADGDTVGIYPNQGSQVYFTIESGGSTSASFDGGGWAFRYGSTYSAYYPFIGNIYLDKTQIPVVFSNQRQTSIDGTDHVGRNLYMYSNPSTVDGRVLNFDFAHLCCLIRFTLKLPPGTYNRLTLTAPDDVFVKRGHYNLSEGNCSIVGDEFTNQLEVNLENISIKEISTFKVYAVSAPVDLRGKEVTVSVRNDCWQEWECTKTPSRTYEAGHSYGLDCKFKIIVSFSDDDFKAYCLENFDTDSDGQISTDEAEAVTEINYTAKSIYLYGLEYFTNLQTLILHSTEVKDDIGQHYMGGQECISKLTKLKHLECVGFYIYDFDISNLSDLEYLDCYESRIYTLDVSHNKQLTHLDCSPIAYDDLPVLIVHSGQVIPNVTVNRSADYIPERTVIYVSDSSSSGGSEGIQEGEEI